MQPTDCRVHHEKNDGVLIRHPQIDKCVYYSPFVDYLHSLIDRFRLSYETSIKALLPVLFVCGTECY